MTKGEVKSEGMIKDNTSFTTHHSHAIIYKL